MMKTILLLLLISVLPYANAAGERKVADYNFDGHDDYRIYRESNGKMHYYDVYLYDPRERKHVHSQELSQLFNPQADTATKEIRCIWPGGHSGKLFYREDYGWDGERLVLRRVVKQTDIHLKDGHLQYIRVTAVIENGKPKIDLIEAVP